MVFRMREKYLFDFNYFGCTMKFINLSRETAASMNTLNGIFGLARRVSLAATILAACSPFATPQNMLQGLASRGSVQLLSSDAAVLETEETKKDLPCTVTQVKPLLGFDLRFHTGYDIVLPLREIAEESDVLTIVFKVTSDTAKDSP